MKLLLLLGGMFGFSIGLFFSRAQENSWACSLWHACLSAYAGGWLLGWWGRAWQTGLKDAAHEKMNRPPPPAPLPATPKPTKT